MPHVRTVKTKPDATAVQVVWSSLRGSRKGRASRVGTRRGRAGVAEGRGRQRIAAGQAQLELGLESAVGGPLAIMSSRMGCPLELRAGPPHVSASAARRAVTVTSLAASFSQLAASHCCALAGLVPDRSPPSSVGPGRVDGDAVLELDDLAAAAGGRTSSPASANLAGGRAGRSAAPRVACGDFVGILKTAARSLRHGKALSSCVVAGERADEDGLPELPRQDSNLEPAG